MEILLLSNLALNWLKIQYLFSLYNCIMIKHRNYSNWIKNCLVYKKRKIRLRKRSSWSISRARISTPTLVQRIVDTYPESLCFPSEIWSKTRAALKRLRRWNTTCILMFVQRVHTWCNAAASPRPPILPFLFLFWNNRRLYRRNTRVVE